MRGDAASNLSFVMVGLDPTIHLLVGMDPRLKAENDGGG
jgi:hypothetical protein